MDAALLLRALCTVSGLAFVLLALRCALTARRLRLRGLRATGSVTARAAAGRGDAGLVVFPDHQGRVLTFDPGAYAPLCGLPRPGASVSVVYLRERPETARLETVCHLLAPSFGWFLAATAAFGTGVVVSP
ncbi:DUF3592 domain-containing protein [Streptomyces sp. NPDC088387]|uniref:DUF3592 domain-containing protein n=1 Tax=Streptomyces sp. NPDC088387 TaxID=3365859 RepID=UPI0037FA5F3D